MNARTKDNPALDITATAAEPGRHQGNLELDGMMAAQLTAAHVALMDCYRHAMTTEHGPTRHDELNLAIKLSRAFATLLRALERRRDGASDKKSAKQPHAKADRVEPLTRRVFHPPLPGEGGCSDTAEPSGRTQSHPRNAAWNAARRAGS